MADGGPIEYDTLVVATGAHHTYFDHPEWATIAPGLKSIEDALEIRRRILIAFEAAEREADPERRRAWMTFVLVGGGPTGVELAGALGEIAHDTLKRDFRAIRSDETRVILLEAMDRILPTYPADRRPRRNASSSISASTVRTEHAGDARRRGRRPVHRTRWDRGIDRGPDRPLGGRRAHRASSRGRWPRRPAPRPIARVGSSSSRT